MKNPIEENLRAEIAFWYSLKDDWEESKNQNHTVYIRIKDALALAEYKLQQYASASNNVKMNLH